MDLNDLQQYKIKRSIINDTLTVALIELEEELKMSESVRAIALPNSSEETPVGTICLVTGWGPIEKLTTVVWFHQLHATFVKIVACERDDVNKICAVNVDISVNDRNACAGDRGAPLVHFVGHVPLLVGIASDIFVPCRRAVMPYTSVAKVRSWIKDIAGI